ncbi:MAG: O-methyltransferase [Bacteroidota bacterium]
MVSDVIRSYVENISSQEPPLLAELNRETHLKVLYPRMLSGPYQGRLLSFISHMIQPKAILEIGTFTGYSTICMAEGLAEGGRITTIERNQELESIIRKWLKKTENTEKVDLLFGPAKEVIPTVQGPFDLVFIDADKHNYLDYYDMVFPMVRKGGFIMADNVLWDGKVADPNISDKETDGIRRFNEFVAQDERVDVLMLPVRDGIMLVRKH